MSNLNHPCEESCMSTSVTTMAGALVKLVRPRQWAKNVFVFAGVVFGGHLAVVEDVARAMAATLLFCLLSGAVYVLNDLRDISTDRLHPIKKNRPLAAGQVSLVVAGIYGIVLLAGSLTGFYFLSKGAWAFAIGYIVLNIFYSTWWKHVVVLDILSVAMGFVIRVLVGVLAVPVAIGEWIVICTLFLALLISLGKRRSEVVLLGNQAAEHRKILGHYPLQFLDTLIVITSSMTVITYSLFTIDGGHGKQLLLTIPFVLYGVFRYLYLVYVLESTDAPEVMVLRDRPMLINGVLWGLVAAALFNVNRIAQILGW